MNQNIHRINDIIKQVPDLKYDASTGWFETDRRALYDFAVLIVRECITIAQDRAAFDWAPPNDVNHIISEIKEHFGVNMNDQDYDEQGGERGWAER